MMMRNCWWENPCAVKLVTARRYTRYHNCHENVNIWLVWLCVKGRTGFVIWWFQAEKWFVSLWAAESTSSCLCAEQCKNTLTSGLYGLWEHIPPGGDLGGDLVKTLWTLQLMSWWKMLWFFCFFSKTQLLCVYDSTFVSCCQLDALQLCIHTWNRSFSHPHIPAADSFSSKPVTDC